MPENTKSHSSPRWLRRMRRVLRRPCKHEEVFAVYGLDGPRVRCRGCGYSERISMQDWQSL